MSESFVAGTQYGDLKGTISLDGFSSPPLYDFAALTDMPVGYWPVGISFYTLHITDGTIPFRIVAVQSSVVGHKTEDVEVYASEHNDEIPVYSFYGKINPHHLEGLFKRIDLNAILKGLDGYSIKVHELE